MVYGSYNELSFCSAGSPDAAASRETRSRPHLACPGETDAADHWRLGSRQAGPGVLTALLLAATLGATPPLLQMRTLAGRPVRQVRPVVLMFWRADCAPCRLELGDLRALRTAAAPMPIQLVGLQPAAEIRKGLGATSLPPDGSVWTEQDAGKVLLSWGGAPARLPLAIALDAKGRLCGRHTGLLGTDQLTSWAKSCGGRHALR